MNAQLNHDTRPATQPPSYNTRPNKHDSHARCA